MWEDPLKISASTEGLPFPLDKFNYNWEIQGFSQNLMQILHSGKVSYRTNQNCSPHLTLHWADIALKDCPMGSPLQFQFFSFIYSSINLKYNSTIITIQLLIHKITYNTKEIIQLQYNQGKHKKDYKIIFKIN